MTDNRHIYGEINNVSDLHDVFEAIRRNVNEAEMRPVLTELYRRAGYLITLTHAPAWDEKFGSDVQELRRVGEEEFRKTAQAINRRAQEIGTEADYDEKWGD